MAYTKPEPFGGRTNFMWTPAGGYQGLDAIQPNESSNALYEGIDSFDLDTGWKRSTFTPSGRYEPGAGGIGTALISDRRPSMPAFGTSGQRTGTSGYGGGVQAFGADVSYLTPTMAKPQIGALPEYAMPEMDRARIGELTELGMGAPMGRLRTGLNRALLEARYSTNPNVRAMARRQALSGYGAGITDIRTGAHREAMGEYMPEYQAAVSKAGAEYQGAMGRMNLQFQADMNEYIRTMKQTRTKVPSGQVTPTGAGGALSNTEEMRQRMANIIPQRTIPYAP